MFPAQRSTLLALWTTLHFVALGSLASLRAETQPPQSTAWGTTASGEQVQMLTIGNGRLTAKLVTYGATLVELSVPDRRGNLEDVVLGWDDIAGYESSDNQYFGCTTGRVCNRIALGKFTLDGESFELAVNNAPNHLHGGTQRSLDKVVWQAKPIVNDRGNGVVFSYTSPDGEEGYPGNLEVRVTYFVPKDRNHLRIDYWAKTDKATPVNLTNHSYFNLAGAGKQTVLDHLLRINADSFTPVDGSLIPTGKIESVAGSALDFRTLTRIGNRIDELVNTPTMGYDHNYVLNEPEENESLRLAAILIDPNSGRRMRITTTEPGVQLYSGNFLMGQTGKNGKNYLHQSALCLETQHFPDSVNQAKFPSTILRPGQEFTSRTVYQFSIHSNEKKKESGPVIVPIEIDVKTVQTELEAGNIVLIDCREESEFETAKIDGSVLLPMSCWMDHAEKLKEYAGKRIVVHCHHGGRSLRITRWLRENGFPDAQNMTGGIDQWSEEIDKTVPRY